jgi:uncharacterized repeat protein (TIGR01451 family)
VLNNGPSDAANVTITDPLPAGTTFVSISPTAVTCSTPAVGATGTVTCTAGSPLAPGTSAGFLVTVHISASLPNGTTLTNTATASTTTSDPDLSNNSSTDTITVVTIADLAITKVDTPHPVITGYDLTYTLTVTNNGPSDALEVGMGDATLTNTKFVSLAAPGGWTCTTPAVGGSGNVICNIPVLPAGDTAVFTVVINAFVFSGTTIPNTAITASVTTTDPNGANNSASVDTPVIGCPPHETHLHIDTVPPDHSGETHEHHGQHGHTVGSNCPPHAPGHTPGLMPETGGELFTANPMQQSVDFVVDPKQLTAAGVIKPGATLRLYGLAAGAVLGAGEGQPISTLTSLGSGTTRYYTSSIPEVFIGGVAAKVVFSGLATGQAGVWQIDAVVPSNVTNGKVPVTVKYEGDELTSSDVVVE